MRAKLKEHLTPSQSHPPVVNAMTVDVEDYFQVSAFDEVVNRESWQGRESRVEGNTARLLDIFDQAGVRATFFILGWVADRYPSLVRRIAARGHELASHGHQHRLVYGQTPQQFRDDLRRARAAIESAAGRPVLGYRAPSYSITEQSRWALDVLVEEGYAWDASIFPIHHDRYGIPGAPRHPYVIRCAAGTIWEVPGSTVRLGGVNLPVAGGGYFRLMPYQWTRWGIQHLNAREGRSAVFYLHPWEIDPEQPRMPVRGLSRLRHYRNLHKTQARLERLCGEFRFGTVSDVLANQAAAAPEDLSGFPVMHLELGGGRILESVRQR